MSSVWEAVDKAIAGYVTLETAKAQAGLPATSAQQEAIQTPTRTSDAQAKAESYTAMPGGVSPAVALGLGVAAVVALLLVLRP